MNPSGLWRGITSDGRIGHFKFINVEMIPQRSTERKRSDRRKRSSASNKGTSSNDLNCQQQSVFHQTQEKSSNDPNEELKLHLGGSERKASATHTKCYSNDDNTIRGQENLLIIKPLSDVEMNSNSRPKSVEDLLRRIGLEVSKS